MNFNYQFPIKLNISSVPFKSKSQVLRPLVKPLNDGFISNPIYDNFGTREQIEAVAKDNPRIQEILVQNKIPLKVNIKELEELKQGHMHNTRIIAAKIYSALPEDLKKEVNLLHLQEAAMLHDYGKVLIPTEILNKSGKLTENEQKIMKLHSELGYELLKDKGVSEKTLNLIKYHHQNLNETGYPLKDNNFEYGIDAQILTVADKYSALREKRKYKSPLAKYEALEVIAKDVNQGNLSQDVYTALIKSV